MKNMVKNFESVNVQFLAVVGLYGVVVVNFLTEFKLEFSALKEMSEEILVKTIHRIRQHIRCFLAHE